MSTWIATSRIPAEKAKDLDEVKPPEGLTSLSKAQRKQFDAAKKAASHLLSAFDGPVNLNISGSAEDPTQVQVTVARAES